MSRLKWMIIGVAALIVLLGTSVAYLWGVYTLHWEGPFVQRVAAVLPIPAATLGTRVVSLHDYFDGVNSIKRYLSSDEAAAQNQRRPVIDDDRKNTLERLLQEDALEELAAARNITVTDAQMSAVLNELNVTSTSTQHFQEFIATNYGWSMDDFKRHIARPLVLTRLLSVSYAADHGGDQTALETYLTQRLQKPDVIRYIKFR